MFYEYYYILHDKNTILQSYATIIVVKSKNSMKIIIVIVSHFLLLVLFASGIKNQIFQFLRF